VQLEKLFDQIKEKLGEHRLRGDEVIFKDCPWCNNDRWNLQVSSSKLKYHCWVCSRGGNLTSLLNFLDIHYVGDLPIPPKERPLDTRGIKEARLPEGVVPLVGCKVENKVMGYLGSRGITRGDVSKYEIMWWPGKERVLFPFRNGMGNLIFWTARTIFKHVRPKYLHADVSKSDKLLKYDGLDNEEIYVVEGVFDGIKVNKLGHTVVVLMGTAISEVVKDYLRVLKKKVVLVLDKDAASKQLKYEDELAMLLGRYQVRALYLPEKDVASIGIPEGCEGFVGYVKSRMGKGKRNE